MFLGFYAFAAALLFAVELYYGKINMDDIA